MDAETIFIDINNSFIDINKSAANFLMGKQDAPCDRVIWRAVRFVGSFRSGLVIINWWNKGSFFIKVFTHF